VMFFLGILVPSLGGVSKEGSVAHVARRLPMPVPRIPREIRDESRLKNPIDWRFLTWREQILGEPERGSMAVLGDDSDRFVDALPSPGVNPLEGSPKCSCKKLGLGRRSRLLAL
jgi:hypothetical protein